MFACFKTNVIVVLELLYLAYPKPKSVLLGNDGIPDPVLKLPIRYVLLNLASAPVSYTHLTLPTTPYV